MNALKSELLKYKRTFTKKLILLISLFFVLYSLVLRMVVPDFSNSWKGILNLIFNWWPFIFLPIGMGLFATLVAGQEKSSGNYRTLLTKNISPKLIWYNKVAVMAIYSFLSTVVLICAILISGGLSSTGAIPFAQIISGGFVCWLVSLILVPIQLWAATWKGVFMSIGIAFVGMIAGVITAPSNLWLAVPWSWATRLMCPIIGIHPNGTILEANNPLLDPSVIWIGIAFSGFAFLITMTITGRWFSRREFQ